MQQQINRIFYNSAQELSKALSNLLCTTFSVGSIENLHHSVNDRLLERGTDQSTAIHKVVYSDFDKGKDSILLPHYYSLLREWSSDLIAGSNITTWALQRFPSLRVQFPGNVSVFEFHRDSDYSHPLGEINHFLAVTQCRDTAALYIEKNLGWEDYVPLTLNEYQSAVINTSIFKHGDNINTENFTRISLDFRAIPIMALQRGPALSSITKGRVFSTEDYFISLQDIPLLM